MVIWPEIKTSIPAIKSSFENKTGTIICNIEKLNDLQKRGIILNQITENRNKVTGVTSEGNISKITLHSIPDKPGIAAKVFKPLSEARINVDVIVQNISRNHKTDLTFTVKNEDLDHALIIVQNKSIKNINYENITSLYHFPNNRWDIKTKNDILIKLPGKNFFNALNFANKIIYNNKFNSNKVIDLRISNHMIISNE